MRGRPRPAIRLLPHHRRRDAAALAARRDGQQVDSLAWVSADGTASGPARCLQTARARRSWTCSSSPATTGCVQGDGEYSCTSRRSGRPIRTQSSSRTTTRCTRSRSASGRHAPGACHRTMTRMSTASRSRPPSTWRSISPPADGGVAFRLETASGRMGDGRSPVLGAPIVYDAVLPPGDYDLWLTPSPASTSRYSLTIERGDPFTTSAEQEPNNSIWRRTRCRRARRFREPAPLGRQRLVPAQRTQRLRRAGDPRTGSLHRVRAVRRHATTCR